jgi:phosphoheptose isomerase
LHPGKFIEHCVEAITETSENGGQIFIAGNGGSAAMANHFAIDINKCANDGTPDLNIRCRSLAANVSEITAWANDTDFSNCFEAQLSRLAKKGDTFLAVSTSGTSSNVVLASEHARANGLYVLALTSEKAKEADWSVLNHAHEALIVPSSHYGRVEDCHSIVLHAIAYAFAEGRAFNHPKLTEPLLNQVLKTREP